MMIVITTWQIWRYQTVILGVNFLTAPGYSGTLFKENLFVNNTLALTHINKMDSPICDKYDILVLIAYELINALTCKHSF